MSGRIRRRRSDRRRLRARRRRSFVAGPARAALALAAVSLAGAASDGLSHATATAAAPRSIPVTACPGATAFGPPAKPPATLRADLSATDAKRLRFYAFDSALILAPGGWRCSGSGGSSGSGARDDPRRTLVVDFTPGRRQVSLAGVVLMRQGRGRDGIADELNRIYGPPSDCYDGVERRWTATWDRWRFAVEYVDMSPRSRCAGRGRFGRFYNTHNFVAGAVAKGWVARTTLGTIRAGTKIEALPARLLKAGRRWVSETGDTHELSWRLGPGRTCSKPGAHPYEKVSRLDVSWYVDNRPRAYGFHVTSAPGRSC